MRSLLSPLGAHVVPRGRTRATRRGCARFLRVAPLLCVALAACVPSARAADAAADLRIHIVSASGEYKSEPSLKEFAEHLQKSWRVTCTASWAKDGATELKDLDQLPRADLLVIFARRMKLPEEQMTVLRRHWEQGKPIVGIRTAGHAFQKDDNELFDRQVLGGHYQGHYGSEPVKVEAAPGQAEHPVLAGVGPFTSRKLYSAGELAADTVVLQTGDIGKARHPVTLVHTYRGGRVVFTSLGVPEDFRNEHFRRMLVNAVFWTTARDADKLKR